MGGAPTSSTSTLAMEAEVHALINRHRESRGLPRLTQDPVLDALARAHSERMARGEVPFGHDGFDDRFNRARANLAISRFSENVGTNSGFSTSDVASQLVTGWINSPGHRQNLEGNYRITGVGIARSARGEFFGTQLFAE
jgi:uncharacterized protein YkwD